MIPRRMCRIGICRGHLNAFSFLSRMYSSKSANLNWSKSQRFAFGAFKLANFMFAVHLFATYVGRPSLMNGASMLPTFPAETSEIVVEEMLMKTLFPNTFLNRGDLITLESPIAKGRLICKRVIGLPGDIICVDPTGQYADPSEHIVVPKGHIWISGDNLTASRDSRFYGPVPVALVKGRIVARVGVTRRIRLYSKIVFAFCRFGPLANGQASAME